MRRLHSGCVMYKSHPTEQKLYFCYKGDIYKVPTEGGAATQLTTQDSYECTPVWSPDGKQIAFASDRNGNFDIFCNAGKWRNSPATDYSFNQ